MKTICSIKLGLELQLSSKNCQLTFKSDFEFTWDQKCIQIITIGYMVYRNYELPWFRTISWYFLFCANYFFYGETINEYFGTVLEVVKYFLIFFYFFNSRKMWRFIFYSNIIVLFPTYYTVLAWSVLPVRWLKLTIGEFLFWGVDCSMCEPVLY